MNSHQDLWVLALVVLGFAEVFFGYRLFRIRASLLANKNAGFIKMRRIAAICSILFLSTTVILFSGTVQAGEKRQHGAHVHGIANLNIAVEGNSIYIEFSSPSANIVGFGHPPRTPEQKDAVANAVNTLQQGDSLFLLSPRSESKLVTSSVDTTIDEEHQGQVEQHDGNHDDADQHERHSEFEARYQFACQEPDRLSQIEVMLFRLFPGIELIKVQLLTESTQTAVELTAHKNKISF